MKQTEQSWELPVNSIIYGPVPSRRLGRSLGVNNIPPKKCTYSCIYCQLGRTGDMQIKRAPFYQPLELARSVKEKVKEVREKGETIDYISFIPDGEPTLDINLGKEIELIKDIGIKVAVITNGSLVWDLEVRQDLLKADWVSLKVDAVTPEIWNRINRPHKHLNPNVILNGLRRFAESFQGELASETMLLGGINDDNDELSSIADFLAELKLSVAYLAIPTRPPAEAVIPAGEQSLNNAYQIFSDKLKRVEYLVNYEGNDFTSTGDVTDDLLSITAVHPMREEAMVTLLNRLGTGWDTIRRLINEDRLVELEYLGKKFYARKFTRQII
ncbi:MAG: radical SAM protein [Dehalococcoidales bacterium]|nr:radical SAM protein [Dehalococcoidales bacterium]